jgi:hypothetical protein
MRAGRGRCGRERGSAAGSRERTLCADVLVHLVVLAHVGGLEEGDLGRLLGLEHVGRRAHLDHLGVAPRLLPLAHAAAGHELARAAARALVGAAATGRRGLCEHGLELGDGRSLVFFPLALLLLGHEQPAQAHQLHDQLVTHPGRVDVVRPNGDAPIAREVIVRDGTCAFGNSGPLLLELLGGGFRAQLLVPGEELCAIDERAARMRRASARTRVSPGEAGRAAQPGRSGSRGLDGDARTCCRGRASRRSPPGVGASQSCSPVCWPLRSHCRFTFVSKKKKS